MENLFKGLPLDMPEEISSYKVGYLMEVKSVDSDRRKFEKIWAKKFGDVFRAAASKAAKAFMDSGGDVHAVDRVIEDFLIPQYHPQYSTMLYDVERHFVKRAGRQLKDPFDEVDPFDLVVLQDWNRTHTATHITRVNQSTKTLVRRIVDRANRDGVSLFDTASMLEQGYPFSRRRAKLIARTEVNSSSNAATHFSIGGNVQPQANLRKIWDATFDGRTRDTHKRADGQKKWFEEAFKVGSSQLMFPGDDSLGAAAKEIINCRCALLYKLLSNRPPRRRSWRN